MKQIEKKNGEIKIFAGGKTVVDAEEKEISNANITKVPAVLVQSRGVIDVIYYDKPFTFKNEMWAYTSPNVTETKFLYYTLKSRISELRASASSMGSLPQISLSATEELTILLPSYDKQKEIVEILDNFDAIINNISKGLPAEIEARQKQYEYYREKLLNFERKD